VRFVEVVVQQPDTGQATPGRLPTRWLSMSECSIDAELFQLSQSATIRPTGNERPPPIGLQKRSECWPVGLRVEVNHTNLIAAAIGVGLDVRITLSVLGRSVRRTQPVARSKTSDLTVVGHIEFRDAFSGLVARRFVVRRACGAECRKRNVYGIEFPSRCPD
jgi:hypothetical protein